MTFLNNSLREQMADELVAHGFKAALDAARIALKEQGDKVYNHIFATHLEAINSLPAEFFHSDDDFNIGINGQRRKIQMTETKRLHNKCDRYHYSVALFSEDDAPEAVKKYLALDDAYDSLEKASIEARHQASNALYSVRTFKKLWEVWPESKSILGKFETTADGKVYLPSVPVQQLNHTFGLSVEGGAQ